MVIGTVIIAGLIAVVVLFSDMPWGSKLLALGVMGFFALVGMIGSRFDKGGPHGHHGEGAGTQGATGQGGGN